MIPYISFVTFLLFSFIAHNKIKEIKIKNFINIVIITIASIFIGFRDYLGGDINAYAAAYNLIDKITIIELHSKDLIWSAIQIFSKKFLNLDYIHFQFLVSFSIIIFCFLSSKKHSNYILIFIISIIIYSLFFNINFQRQALAASIIFYISTFKIKNKWFYLLFLLSLMIYKSGIIFIFYLIGSKINDLKINIIEINRLIFFLIVIVLILFISEFFLDIFSKDYFKNIFEIINYLSSQNTKLTFSKSILIIMPLFINIYLLKKSDSDHKEIYFNYFIVVIVILVSLFNIALIERLLLIFYFYQFIIISKFYNYISFEKYKIYSEIFLICMYINYIIMFFYLTNGSEQLIYSNYYL